MCINSTYIHMRVHTHMCAHTHMRAHTHIHTSEPLSSSPLLRSTEALPVLFEESFTRLLFLPVSFHTSSTCSLPAPYPQLVKIRKTKVHRNWSIILSIVFVFIKRVASFSETWNVRGGTTYSFCMCLNHWSLTTNIQD